MTLLQLIQKARTLYGLDPTVEDAVFTNAIMTVFVNTYLHDIEADLRPFQATQSINVVSGTAGYTLDELVIDIDRATVRITRDGSNWWVLKHEEEGNLLREDFFGPAENLAAGTPEYFTLKSGTGDAGQKRIELWPKPDFSGTAYLKFTAWVYSADLSGVSDVPDFAAATQYQLLPGICLQMAEFDLSNNADGAAGRVAYFARKEAMAREKLEATFGDLMGSMTHYQ